MGQNAIAAARDELRCPGTRLIGSVAYFPERYGDELIPRLSASCRRNLFPGLICKTPAHYSQKRGLVYPLDARVGNRSTSLRQERAAAQFA